MSASFRNALMSRAASELYSTKRKFCADYGGRHRKPIVLKDVRKWTASYSKHEHVHNIQRHFIWQEKNYPGRRHVVLHFDFAENWTVSLPNEVQGHYWQRRQVSLFMCVVKTLSSTLSLVAVSDDMRHDSAHAVFALREIVLTTLCQYSRTQCIYQTGQRLTLRTGISCTRWVKTDYCCVGCSLRAGTAKMPAMALEAPSSMPQVCTIYGRHCRTLFSVQKTLCLR